MGESSTIRRTLIGSVAVAVVAPMVGVLATPATPAFAIGTLQRVSASTPVNLTAEKSVVVGCEAPAQLFAPGGRVIDGGGDVFLTAIVPNVTAETVTVTARLRPLASPRPWGLVAHAVCATTPTAPTRAEASSSVALTTTATCPAGTRVFGTGFRLDAAANVAYTDQVVPDVGLTQVRVGASRRLPGALTVNAFAVCHPSVGLMTRVESTSAFDGTWPKTATFTESSSLSQVYGVGGRINGASGVLLDGLVPEPSANRVNAMANRIPGDVALPGAEPQGTELPGGDRAGAATLAAEVMADDGSVTAYGVDIGTFCVGPTN